MAYFDSDNEHDIYIYNLLRDESDNYVIS